MRYINLIAILALVVGLVSGCAKQEDDLCKTLNDEGKSECKVGGETGTNTALLSISYGNTNYFDQNENTWKTWDSSSLSSSQILEAVPLYASASNISRNDALSLIVAAEDQRANGSQTKNPVPFIKVVAKQGARYIFSYRRFPLNATAPDYEQTGELIVQGGYAYIPFVNDFLGGKVYENNAAVGTQYKNVFTILAQAFNQDGAARIVQFNTILSVANADYTVAYSNLLKNQFNLDRRWTHYYNATGTGPNTDFEVLNLLDKFGTIENSPVDVRLVFKNEPRVTIEQEVFFEMPFQFDLFRLTFGTTNTVTPERGYAFYSTVLTTDSTQDFQHKVKVGGRVLSKNSLQYNYNNFPAGSDFNIHFSADLTQNVNYTTANGDPNAKGLLYPLKPSCAVERNAPYAPLIEEANRDQVRNDPSDPKYLAICHLDKKTTLAIGASDTDIKFDTWFNFFDYRPYRPERNALGGMYGIRYVKFKVEACFKVQVRVAGGVDVEGAPNGWRNKTSGGSNCGDSSSGNTWTYVNSEKTFSIFDNYAAYEAVQGLKPILDKFKNSGTIPANPMKFNNEKLQGNTIRHIY